MADHVSKESILGVIGLGNAGHAIASALAKLMPVHGYDLEEDKRFSASQIGIITHDQFDTFTEAIDVAILSLPHPEISFSVTEQLLGLETRPKLIIDTSTVTPKTASDCASLASLHGVGFVDAAIAGGVASMADGQMTFFM